MVEEVGGFRTDMLVGEENQGWKLITTQLNHERVMLGPAGKVAGIYDRVHAWASKPGADGVTPLENDNVRRALGEIRNGRKLSYWMWYIFPQLKGLGRSANSA